MAAFIAISSKKSETASFTEPLAKFISSEYSADPKDYAIAVKVDREFRGQ